MKIDHKQLWLDYLKDYEYCPACGYKNFITPVYHFCFYAPSVIPLKEEEVHK
jgi:hypothetical protein